MSISAQEINYTPSKWSKRFNETQILMHYYKFAKEITADARKSLKCKLDVPYATTERTKYDIYGTDLPKESPIFLFIHGGYWQEGSKDIAAFAAPIFVRKGIKVITIGYDLCPNVKLGNIIHQVKTAVEHILKYASSLGCRNIWVSGHSAGAHLAASLLFDELWLDNMTKEGYLNLLKGIVLIGGVFNLKPLIDTNISTALKLTKDEINTYSFTTLNTKNNTPVQQLKVIVTIGQCDSPGLINESRECAQKLVTMVDHVEYIFLRENIDHFDIVEKLTDEEFVLTKLILSNILYE
ncbi:Kynurenine formamidase [Anthophora plagiata]